MLEKFTLFPNLAPELRDEIWRYALPDPAGPALFFYKPGCWRPRQLTEADEGYLPEQDETNNMELWFRHELLNDDAQFNVPIFYVNQEARSIALAWCRKEGIKVQPRGDGRYNLLRPFDPVRDALYVQRNKWEDFCKEPVERLAAPDMSGRSATIQTQVERLAVPLSLFLESSAIDWLPETMGWYDRLKELFVVVGEQPDWGRLRWQWSIDNVERGAFVWDAEQGSFEEGKVDFGDEELNTKASDITRRVLHEQLVSHGITSLEVRPVYVILK